MATRKYAQRLRAESAEDTQRRILDALSAQLCQAPAEPVSIDRVAAMAGVARSTVYTAFGSRAGLFCALGADILERGGFADMLRASADPDARKALRGGLRGVVRMYAATRDVLRALHSMAQLDCEVGGGAIARMNEGRAQGMEQLARRLAEQQLLRPDVTERQAADLLWILTSFDSFDLLYTGRARTVAQTADLLTAAAERSVCP